MAHAEQFNNTIWSPVFKKNGVFLATYINRTVVYPYHCVAPSRGILVTVTHTYSCHTSHLFWIEGRRDEHLASSLCTCLRKVSFNDSAAEVILFLSVTCDHWKKCMCQLCAICDFSWIGVTWLPTEVTCRHGLWIRADVPALHMPNSELNLSFCSGLCILNKQRIDCLKKKKKKKSWRQIWLRNLLA